MKNRISFLVILGVAFSMNYADASECVGDDCELTPIVFEQNFAPMDLTEIDESFATAECDSDILTETVSCTYNYDCPFKTAAECAVWYKKPVHKTNLFPRAPHLNNVSTDEILYAIYSNYDVTANDPAMAALLERYKILMRASKACCTEGIIHKMRLNKTKDSKVYQFLKDDANYFAVTERCMVMNNDEFESSYSNGVTGEMAIDVRNACLCKNRQWFNTLLEPFYDIYNRAPMFKERPFAYTYTDSMQREITVYINDEVHNTMGLLNACPD